MTDTSAPVPADAAQILHLHLRVTVPEPVCNRCLTKWPCDAVKNARVRP